MVKESAVLQLGVKGADLIVSTFKKINDQKAKFAKKAVAGIGAAAGFLTAKGGAQASRDAMAESQKNAAESETRLAAAAKGTGKELIGLAHAASSMNPAALLQGVAGSLGRAANAINLPGMGLISAAADIAGAGIAAAGNALSAVKSALPTAIDTKEKQGRLEHFGGAGIGVDANGKDMYSLSEKAALIDGAVNKFGKIGVNFKDSIKRLVDAGINPGQAAAVASGNFAASGTDTGFFYQKIADSFSGLPPSIAQEMQAQLMDSFGTGELMQDTAAAQRSTAAAMDANDRATAVTIAGNAAVVGLNAEMNKLQISMVSSGAALSGMVASFGAAINKVLRELPTAVRGGQAAASDWRTYVGGLVPGVNADSIRAIEAAARR